MRIITEIKVIDDLGDDITQAEMDAHAREVRAHMEGEINEDSELRVSVYKESKKGAIE